MELTLPDYTITMNFGDHIADLRNQIPAEDYRLQTYPDVFPGRVDIISNIHGFTLFFKELGVLSSCSLVIEQENYSKFTGTCSYLGSNFWQNPSQENFALVLKQQDFQPLETKNRLLKPWAKNNLRVTHSMIAERKAVNFSLLKNPKPA